VFPDLRVSARYVSRARLREVTLFSIYVSISDWAATLNYSVDALVVGASLGVSAVAVWSVAQRVADGVVRVTNQLSDVLLPAFVDHAAASRTDRLAVLLVQATRLSLAAVIALGTSVAVLAAPLVMAWVGPSFAPSVLVLQLLVLCAIVRVGISTSLTLLKGSGRHRFVAAVTSGMAVANLALSLLLVRYLGFAGVALGTLVPIASAACFVTFPAACRRVNLPVRTAFSAAVWPAVWPGFVIALLLAFIRPLVSGSIVALGAAMAASVATYGALFFFRAIGREDRRRYLAAADGLRMRLPLRAVSEGA
jgi:O-antigen/teichoic acid export membrane protein